MIALFWHLWVKGHSVTVNRNITVGLGDSSSGWLYRCECGMLVAR